MTIDFGVGCPAPVQIEGPQMKHCVLKPRATKQTIYSWFGISGCREASSASVIMLIPRSSWKRFAAFFAGSTFRKIATYFWRSWAAKMSESNQRRMRLSACSSVKVRYSSAYSSEQATTGRWIVTQRDCNWAVIRERAVTTYRQLPTFWQKTAGTCESHSRKTLLVKEFGISCSGP